MNTQNENVTLSTTELRIHQEVFPLHAADEERLVDLRYTGIPLFLYKVGNSVFYTNELHGEYYLMQLSRHITREHLCAKCTIGGCPCKYCYLYVHPKESYITSIMNARRIERFPWIKEGFETFHLAYYQAGDIFQVYECSKFSTKKIE